MKGERSKMQSGRDSVIKKEGKNIFIFGLIFTHLKKTKGKNKVGKKKEENDEALGARFRRRDLRAAQ